MSATRSSAAGIRFCRRVNAAFKSTDNKCAYRVRSARNHVGAAFSDVRNGRNPSWLNAVEGFFAKLTRQCLKRGVFRSVVDLQVAINRFVADTNANPKPFVWTADPKRVLAAVKRGKQTLESVHSLS